MMTLGNYFFGKRPANTDSIITQLPVVDRDMCCGFGFLRVVLNSDPLTFVHRQIDWILQKKRLTLSSSKQPRFGLHIRGTRTVLEGQRIPSKPIQF